MSNPFLLRAAALFLTAVLCVESADLDRRIEFKIGGGESETALRQFAIQSGRQVIYPSELVSGIKLNPAQGPMTAKQGLDRLLEGTTLVAWQDEQTGALAIGLAPKAARERPIELPPYVVSEKSDMRWRYASATGVEVLSRCPDPITYALMEQHNTLHAMLETILPKKLQFHTDVPTAYLFFTADDKAAITMDLVTNLQRREEEASVRSAKQSKYEKASYSLLAMPNYRFWDQDALSIFVLWDDTASAGTYYRLRLTPSYVRYLLERRAPALPQWFINGISDLYQHTEMASAPSTPWNNGYSGTPFQRYAVELRPQLWISAEQTAEILKHPKARVEILSMKELFAEQRVIHQRLASDVATAPDDDASRPSVIRLPEFLVDENKLTGAQAEYYEQLRRSQADLFIRWMLDGGKPERAQALWKLVDRASTERMTEEIFRQCTGLGYEQVEKELQAYVRTACRDKVVLHAEAMPVAGLVEMRDATKAEVSRIKGDFNRLEIPYVRQVYPEMTGEYVQQARATLRRSYNEGDRDPRLLAQLGLCECDAGNDAGAVTFLEAAMKAKVVRPRVYFELARIRIAALLAVEGNDQLTAAQLTTVLEPLFRLRGQAPAMVEAYELMADAWLRCTASPSPEQLAYVNEGPKIFSRRPRLLLSVALLNYSHGQLADASRLVERGLSVTSEPKMRARFQELKDAIAAGREK